MKLTISTISDIEYNLKKQSSMILKRLQRIYVKQMKSFVSFNQITDKISSEIFNAIERGYQILNLKFEFKYKIWGFNYTGTYNNPLKGKFND